MAKNRTGWYERTEIPKVTLDWLKANYKPTNREMELLRIVKDRKLVNRAHLEILCPSYRDAGQNRTRLINRAIKRLYTNMCLDKVSEKRELKKGNNPFTVALDKGGSLLLNVSHKKRIPHTKKLVNGEEYIFRGIPSIIRHTNGLNQVEVDTILFCEKNGYSILDWQHEKGREFKYGNENVTVIPDSFVNLNIKNKKVYIYIEYDTASEDRGRKTSFPVILGKIIKYKKFKMSNIWMEDSTYFPILLLVTEDKNRIDYFNKKCKENKLRGFGVYHENYTKFLEHLATLV